MKNFIYKHKNKLLWFITALLAIWLESLTLPSFDKLNQYLFEHSNIFLSGFMLFILNTINYKISLHAIIIFLVLLLIFYTIYKYLNLKRRKFKLLTAEYGSGTRFVDITNQLNNFVQNKKLYISLHNAVAGVDPTPGIVKVVKIRYRLNGKIHKTNYTEGQVIDLP